MNKRIKRKLQRRRQFSDEVRRNVVREFREGKYTVKELAKLYHVSAQSIYRWIHKFSSTDKPTITVVEMADSTDKKLKDLHQKIADLQRALGQKQIKLDFYEKMMDLAEEEYGLDLKKFFYETIGWFRENRDLMSYSLNALYTAAGVSKQAVWAHFKREARQPEGMGRDRFCAVMMELGYGVRRTRNNMRTTVPAHKVFENLIEGRVVTGPNQVWQSDITYIKVGGRFYYLTFIIDVYSRRIVGYATSRSLRAEANVKALKQAIAGREAHQLKDLVHHSDRGSQYTDGRYLALLRSHQMPISMGKVAQDNAFAERINGTIKNEYLLPKQPKSFRQLKQLASQAVTDYNTIRQHNALGRKAPEAYEQEWASLEARKRPVEAICSHRTPPINQKCLNSIDRQKKQPYCMVYVN
ncbi:IS3 family transposase [Fodinibius halophilus]|uniref:IS3 family transposase n=1 Tax=Fodinibius halophilus TaxID=1736908 RepID=A0A6M1T4X0_9BACT|nr:IS3 family transposase [Fodinibius halophilus]NGP87723.1 IS3 family transposase [Fodinibius halophilus]